MCECEVPRERGGEHVQCDVLYMLIVVTYRSKSCVEESGRKVFFINEKLLSTLCNQNRLYRLLRLPNSLVFVCLLKFSL